jgi:peptidoglycan hydrolase-like protein with peptidoglycan-binding domain
MVSQDSKENNNMAELTFDQLSPEEKEAVVSFYNSQGQDTGVPITEATLPPARQTLSPPPVDVTSLDTGEPVSAPNRSWRDMVVATEVSPTKSIMTDGPDMDEVQAFQERNGLPRDGVLDENTFRAMSAQALAPQATDNSPTVDNSTPPTPAANVDTAQVEAAETTEEVIETVAEAVPTELSQNPVEYIVENNLRGLDERNPLGAEAIRGFFRTATGSSLGAEAAWCAVFVDSVLRGIDAAPMARDQVSIFPDTRGTVGRAGPQRAREYENYGTGVELDDIKAGDLVILQGSNRGSGHIGFYTGERDENGRYLVLGGNQSSGGDGRTSEELSQLVAGVVGQESLTTRQLQQIVGATVDGAYGPATERNVRQYLRTQGIDNYAGGGSRGVSVNVSPYASSNFAAVRRIEDIQDLPVDVMKEVTASITGNAAGTR